MGLKYFLVFILIFFASCGGPGTEVVNPPQPGETPKIALDFKSSAYRVGITVPTNWTYIEYGPGKTVGSEAFTDINPQTLTVATFSKQESRFTTFYSIKSTDQTLLEFIRERRPVGLVDIQHLKDSEGFDVSLGIFNQTEAGPRGGLVFDAYFSKGNEILWLRAELVGSDEKKRNTLDEFNEIFKSLKIF